MSQTLVVLHRYMVVRLSHQEEITSELPPKEFLEQLRYHRAYVETCGITVLEAAIWWHEDSGKWVGLYGTKQKESLFPLPDEEWIKSNEKLKLREEGGQLLRMVILANRKIRYVGDEEAKRLQRFLDGIRRAVKGMSREMQRIYRYKDKDYTIVKMTHEHAAAESTMGRRIADLKEELGLSVQKMPEFWEFAREMMREYDVLLSKIKYDEEKEEAELTESERKERRRRGDR
ncbi:MAG: hypothetical protein ACYCYO_03780 [Bacilli bacterium]